MNIWFEVTLRPSHFLASLFLQTAMATSGPHSYTALIISLLFCVWGKLALGYFVSKQEINANDFCQVRPTAPSVTMDWAVWSSQKIGMKSAENFYSFYPAFSCARYDLLSRPVNLFPLERDVINTEFLLFTRTNPEPRKININSRRAVRKAGFSGKKPTKIIIHGFLDHGDVRWIKVKGKRCEVRRTDCALCRR